MPEQAGQLREFAGRGTHLAPPPSARRAAAGAREYFAHNCEKSLYSCTWNYAGDDGEPGKVGARRAMSAPPGFVVVGVGIRYDPGLTTGASSPALSWAESHVDWDPPAGRGPTVPEVRMAAHVYAFPYIVCAPAWQVAAGTPPEDLRTLRVDARPAADLSLALPGSHLARATEATAGPGYALAAVKVGTEEGAARGAEQVSFVWREFAAGHPDATATEAFPERVSAPLKEEVAGCVAHPRAVGRTALYVAALAWAPTDRDPRGMFVSAPHHPRVGRLELGCADYVNLLDPPSDYALACCTGKEGLYCRPTWSPQSPACDGFMGSYCAASCASGACADPVCGCLGSPLSDPATLPPGASPLPQCFDARCADDPDAYRPAGMSDASCGGAVLTCADVDALGGPGNVAAAWQSSIPAGCDGAPPGGKLFVVLVVILLVLVALLASVRGGKTAAPRAPGTLPPLPELPRL